MVVDDAVLTIGIPSLAYGSLGSVAAVQDNLIQIIYRSKAAGVASEVDLHSILITARTFNAENSITGMLLYHHRVFVQLLEGPDAVVRSLYSRILDDRRHRNIETLVDGPIETRRFAEWAMAFRIIDQLGGPPLRGMSPVLEHRRIDLAGLDALAANALFSDLGRGV